MGEQHVPQELLGAAEVVVARPWRQEEAGAEEAGRVYPWQHLAEVVEVRYCHLGAEAEAGLLWHHREGAEGAEASPSDLPLPWLRPCVFDHPP